MAFKTDKQVWTNTYNSDGTYEKGSYCDDKQLEASHSNSDEIADYVMFDRILKYNKENDYTNFQSTPDELIWLSW